jgi:hypothetical protein
MSTRLTLPVQWSLTLVIGLLLGVAFQPVGEVASPTLGVPTSTATAILTLPPPVPFVTLPGGLFVRVKYFRNEAPQFVKIFYLDQARLTVFPKGEDLIEILDPNGQVLYSQFYKIEFLEGDPPRPVDSITVIFVLPAMENALEVVITTSNGRVEYDIPAK